MKYSELVRQSCKQVVEKNLLQHVSINNEKLKEFFVNHIEKNLSANPSFFQRKAGFILPIKFDSLDHEINFTVLYSILNFGSGYRVELKNKAGRGAAETITFGLFSMALGDAKMESRDLTALSLEEVSSFFGIPIKEERPSKIHPAIKEYVDSNLKFFAESLHKVLNEAGNKLWKLSCKDFATFVRQSLEQAKKQSLDPVDYLLKELIESFGSILDDFYTFEEQKVYFYKRAQLVVGELYSQFHDRDEIFNFPRESLNKLTAFVDNVLPAVFRIDGVLEITDEKLKEKIEKEVVLKPGREEAELRVAAVEIFERLVALSNGKVNAMELDYYIWGNVGKQPSYRQQPRHYCQGTIFY